MTLGVRGVVENDAGEVLFVRHTYTRGLFLPGGGVERGETMETALRRELQEEGGVKVTGTPALIGVFSNHHIFRNDHVVLYRLGHDAWTKIGHPVGREISEISWHDPAAPPDDVTPGTQRRLQELYGGAPVSQYW